MVQLKWIRGYVRIRVRGFGAERLINLCARRGICLWNIERQTDCISMCLSLKDFFSIRPLVRKSRTRVTVSERCGLPFFMIIVGKRKAFVIGLLMAVLFWMLSNGFVWDIRLGGNYSVSEDMFRSFLKTEGVTVGMKRRDLDIETLEKQIRRSFPQVTWASARLDGIRLSIEIKENDVLMEPETPEEETGADLVSPVEGRILSMIVREGIPMCKIGDTVQAGDVLVSGKVPVKNDDGTIRRVMLVDSSAAIELEHTIFYEEHLPYSCIKKQYTGRTGTVPYLRFGEKILMLPVKISFLQYDLIGGEDTWELFRKFSVPFAWGRMKAREYMNVECEVGLREAVDRLEEKYAAFLKDCEDRGLQIIAKDGKMDSDECAWVYSAELVVREVFTEQELKVFEENDSLME